MSEEGEAAPIEAPIESEENAPNSEGNASEAPDSVQATDEAPVAGGNSTAADGVEAAGGGADAGAGSEAADGGDSADAPAAAAEGEEAAAADIEGVVADGDAVAAAESGDHASESVASAGDTVATSVQEDAIAADAGNDHEVAAADAGNNLEVAGADAGNDLEVAAADADGEDATADSLAAAPADGDAIEAASEVGGSDSVAEAHTAAAASSDCSHAAVLPAPSELEAPVAAPVKTKGSAHGELPYYTPAQVASHSVAADCWLSLLGKVIDATELVRRESPELVQSIVSAAGTDVSHWFSKDGELKTVHDLKSGLRRYQTPGDLPLLHAPPPHPVASFDMSFGDPWWRQEKLVVGTLTQKTRKLRVVNMLMSSSHVIDVCAEQKICDINDLYRAYNAHAGSYTWKKLNKQGKMEVLDYQKTLQENDLPDMSKELAELLIDEADYLPAVYLYFDDDLTKA